MSTILFSSRIGPISIECIISEKHASALGITELPIETGAKITDHSYVEPKRLELDFADSGAADTWNALVRFQASRKPFDIVSGLYLYKSMLIKDLTAERDYTTSRILKGTALIQEVILVETARTASDKKADGNGKPKDGATKDKTDGTKTRGDQPLAPKRDQSGAHRLVFGSGDPGPLSSGTGRALMDVFRIIDAADQQFGVVLNRRRVTMRLRYNPTSNRWSFDLAIDDRPVLYGRRIVLNIDLLRPFDFGIGVLFATEAGSEPVVPGRNELINGRVEFIHTSAEEVADYVASVSP